MKKGIALTALVAVFYALHQDFWNWRAIEPLVFGFLPAGLAYHAAYSLCAAGIMALLVKFAWPKGLDPESESTTQKEHRP
jgi:hypothetical protein